MTKFTWEDTGKLQVKGGLCPHVWLTAKPLLGMETGKETGNSNRKRKDCFIRKRPLILIPLVPKQFGMLDGKEATKTQRLSRIPNGQIWDNVSIQDN